MIHHLKIFRIELNWLDFPTGWRKEGGARVGRFSRKPMEIGFCSSKRESFSGASESPQLPVESGYMVGREQTPPDHLELGPVIGSGGLGGCSLMNGASGPRGTSVSHVFKICEKCGVILIIEYQMIIDSQILIISLKLQYKLQHW